jgi:serine/threonine protein kinase
MAGSSESSERGQRTPGQIWRFAGCDFDERRRELRVRGTAVDIESKPLDVLRELLAHAGEVVTKEELLEAAWPGLMVVDGSLATAVSKLRKALGDEHIIVTVPRVGYRMAVPVQSKPLAPPPWPDLDLRAGEAVPGRLQWRLGRRLDVSPSSEVWLADHTKTGDRRVFKFAPDAQRLKDLKREVTVARLLRQTLGERADFVRLLEWNFDAPPYFLESEYCGPNLAEWAEAHGGLHAVPLDVRLRLLIDIAEAVAAAHGCGVLHKDLKPGNILATGGRDGVVQIKVADFGSASLLAPARLAELGITNLGFTQAGVDLGTLTGTVMYLAPELVGGQSPTPASDVYALGVLLYQLIVGDFRRPLAPGWEADVTDPLLRDDIAEAACGDPARRLATATAFADRLRTLDRRRREATDLQRSRDRALAAEQKRAATRARRPWLALAAMPVLAAVAFGLYFTLRPAAAPAVKALAVLPFENVGSDTSLDFLRLALADEVANTLTRTRGIVVRPFARSSSYAPGSDLEQVARDLKVDGIVTGRFVRRGSQLHITLEAVDAARGEAVWRDAIDAPAESLIAAQVQIGLRVRGGLAPAFGGSAADVGAQPRNEQAYELYLRSAALPFDASHNAEALGLLEQSVALDGSYAPSWLVLARRYYVESRYNSGDPSAIEKWRVAVEHGLALEPDNVTFAAGYLRLVAEQGDLLEAHRRSEELVRRYPDSVDAHFTLSYALRYAGLLREAASHCETALFLDARTQTSGLRSCAVAFIQLADYPRALNYIHLDLGSGYARAMSIDMLVRQGREREALEVGSPELPQWASYDVLLACMGGKPAHEIRELARSLRPVEDPEANYLSAAHLAYCGETDAALAMLRRAIEGHYCSYPALETDPLLASLRSRPEFAELVTAGRSCQQTLLAQLRPSSP